MQFIDNVPLGAFFILMLIISIFWTEYGYRIGKARAKAYPNDSQATLGTIVASILSLLAFILAFTFNVALSRFEDRRVAVLEEANAIGTTYLRAEFFDAPQKEQVKKLLREYVQVRLPGIVCKTSSQPIIPKSETLQNELWTMAINFGKEHMDSPVCALFISSLNEVIDLHAKRVTLGLHARVPCSVWIVLLIISFLSMLSVGYYCGMSGNRNRAETYILISIFALVMLLVVDLDRPFEGFIKTSQQPMIDLSKSIGVP